MKQVEYTEKQELVIELVNDIYNYIGYDKMWGSEKSQYFKIREEIYKKYGIKEKFLTLREYINEYGCGAYHHFAFEMIYGITRIMVEDITSVYDFECIYNPSLLDKFYVIDDQKESNNGDCENYQCNHFLTIVRKED